MNNKDYLSQEEIDALLRQSSEDSGSDDNGDDGFGDGFDLSGGEPDVSDYLSPMEQDALGEIGNITFGSAATALSTLLGKKVDITTPQVSAIGKDTLEEQFPKPHVSVHVNYVDGFQGINLLVIKTIDAKVIADLMLGGDGTNTDAELNEIHISAVQEAMNQMMGSSATSMSTLFNRFINISPPGIDILDFQQEDGAKNFPEEDVFIKVSFRIKIGDLIDSTLMQLLPVQFARDMISILLGGEMTAESTASKIEQNTVSMRDLEEVSFAAPPAAKPPVQKPSAPQQPPAYPDPAAYHQPPAQQPPFYPEQQAYDPMIQYQNPAMGGYPPSYPPNPYASMPPQGGYPQPPYPQQNFANRNVNVQPVQYSNFTPPQMLGDQSNLNMLLDIPLKVTVELGRTQRIIKDILELSQGSIIELDKLAGEPVDILVNNKLIAKGEVVVIDENFGVRVTDIISQMDRIQKLQ